MVTYHVNTGQVWYSNDLYMFDCGMVWFLNGGLKTGQKNLICVLKCPVFEWFT